MESSFSSFFRERVSEWVCCYVLYGLYDQAKKKIASVCQRKSSKNTQLHRGDECAHMSKMICFACMRKMMAKKNAHIQNALTLAQLLALRVHTRRRKRKITIRNRNINNPHFIAMWWTDPTWGQQKPKSQHMFSFQYGIAHMVDAANIFISAIHFSHSFSMFLYFPLKLRQQQQQQQLEKKGTATTANSSGFHCLHEIGSICGFIYSVRSRKYREWKMKLRQIHYRSHYGFCPRCVCVCVCVPMLV